MFTLQDINLSLIRRKCSQPAQKIAKHSTGLRKFSGQYGSQKYSDLRIWIHISIFCSYQILIRIQSIFDLDPDVFKGGKLNKSLVSYHNYRENSRRLNNVNLVASHLDSMQSTAINRFFEVIFRNHVKLGGNGIFLLGDVMPFYPPP